ncbi:MULTISPECIES: hypothetical protein [Streptomycetaceae]|uniref:hypothetical protein n=1 Tax=Streptomycetaceae TaxID=2062 RepID=UPI001160FC23|nr:hypothetical protein [Streptomyces sp. CB02056]
MESIRFDDPRTALLEFIFGVVIAFATNRPDEEISRHPFKQSNQIVPPLGTRRARVMFKARAEDLREAFEIVDITLDITHVRVLVIVSGKPCHQFHQGIPKAGLRGVVLPFDDPVPEIDQPAARHDVVAGQRHTADLAQVQIVRVPVLVLDFRFERIVQPSTIDHQICFHRSRVSHSPPSANGPGSRHPGSGSSKPIRRTVSGRRPDLAHYGSSLAESPMTDSSAVD